tara:strand:+ start:96 stop:440 length:345 start_codon:yes stop_codon:yes gene_type:complete
MNDNEYKIYDLQFNEIKKTNLYIDLMDVDIVIGYDIDVQLQKIKLKIPFHNYELIEFIENIPTKCIKKIGKRIMNTVDYSRLEDIYLFLNNDIIRNLNEIDMIIECYKKMDILL